ncbi:MAG: tyrosine-type recombinase/integrase [Patescibacteria group bacterium]|nr:tyrosine-type recombinase/integrase [Patescibacteria group bacterium]
MVKRTGGSPRVTLVEAKGRNIELRYWCPVERRFVRRSSGTKNRRKAEREAHRIEDEIANGAYAVPGRMSWTEFVGQYNQDHLFLQRTKTCEKANTVLTLVGEILKPQTLDDVADPRAIVRFRTALAAGRCSRFGRPRSPHTVKSYVVALVAALNWAKSMGLINEAPDVPPAGEKGGKKTMKGRPITGEEFERMLSKVESVVGEAAAESWKFLLWGLWQSALRIEEAMSLSWDIPWTIQPVWRDGAEPTLFIPGEEQKNTEDDEIPLLPWFEEVLLRVPESDRTGWIFRPASVDGRYSKSGRNHRPDAEWVGKIISRIGKAANVVVEAERGEHGEKGYRKVKYASAHDLRRSCADRLDAEGVDPRLIARLLRHKSFETTRRHYLKTDVQRDAKRIRSVLVTSKVTSGEVTSKNTEKRL